MSNRLLVDATRPHGKMLVETVDLLRRTQDSLNRLRGAIDMMVYGNPTDYAAMKTELGMATDQNATDLFFLLSAAETALEVDVLKEFVKRCDQG